MLGKGSPQYRDVSELASEIVPSRFAHRPFSSKTNLENELSAKSSQGPKMRPPGNAPGGNFIFTRLYFQRLNGGTFTQGLHTRIYILSDADFALIIRGFTKAPNWHD